MHGPHVTGEPAALKPRQREALRALVDTLLPSLEPEPGDSPAYWRRSGSDVGVPDALEEIVLTRLPPDQARGFRAFLNLLANPAGVTALGGPPRRFVSLPPRARALFLMRLAESRVPLKRQAFQGVKKLACYLHYALVDEENRWNPNWPDAGYAPAGARVDRTPPAEPVMLPALTPEAADGARVDVVVVGSGAGGSVVAAHLARAGHSVLVVESGPERSARDYSDREMEAHADLYAGSGLFATRDGSVQILAGNAAGGGTTVNWMTSLEPPAWLLTEWDARGVPGLVDGGAPSNAFRAHVDAVTKRLNVTTAESALNGPNRVLAEGARRLGWKEGEDWHVIPRNAAGCRSRCDACAFGCPFEAKRDARVTFLKDAADAGARFLFNARVEGVLVDDGRATGVLVDAVDDAGREHAIHVRARHVVVAAGAVHSAALLLRSRVTTRGVGRLFIHPTSSVIGRYAERVPMWEGPMQSIAVTRFQDMDGAHRGALLEAVPAHPGLAASALPWRGARAFKRDMRDLAQSAGLIAITRDRDPGRVRVDARGEPLVDYRVSRYDAAHLTRGLQALAQMHHAAGADAITTLHAHGVRVDADASGRIRDADFNGFVDQIARAGASAPHTLGLFTAHQMGTVALGRDGEAPATPRGELFDVENLWVADASAFPTPSGVNPMITIMVLARRTAGFIGERLRSEP